MDIVTIRFTTKWPPNLASLATARLGGSRDFSHSMNIIDGKVFEATMLHGCRVGIPLEVAMQGVAMYQDMYVPVRDKAAAIAWGLEQYGRPYDFAGALGIPFLASEDWANDDAWWCSELSFMQVLKGGTAMLDPNVCKRVTPAHLLMCNFAKSEVVRLRSK
ncbi:hypothetical protein EDC30_109108 [Paucimonas lemoignei]|uniref:Uncharacterized protein n=1 Tax=Paucimonas lemoignei TaxID=29443 RepID=A0A4R3HWN8_PAULE|nr:hypothetical protein [Paucimonas lemoignei]TCS35809.1 hypothetical protein EDC30_109108 [Paucimonas lemoignei]